MIRLRFALVFIFMSSMFLLSCVGNRTNNNTLNIDNQGMDSKRLVLEIDGKIQDVAWNNNRSVEALKKLAKDGLEILMSNYGGFEQVGDLGQSLPDDDGSIKTIPGDICLYSSDKLVIFYSSNSWSYTHLGKINLNVTELKTLLDKQRVVVKLFTEESKE